MIYCWDTHPSGSFCLFQTMKNRNCCLFVRVQFVFTPNTDEPRAANKLTLSIICIIRPLLKNVRNNGKLAETGWNRSLSRSIIRGGYLFCGHCHSVYRTYSTSLLTPFHFLWWNPLFSGGFGPVIWCSKNSFHTSINETNWMGKHINCVLEPNQNQIIHPKWSSFFCASMLGWVS